MNARHSLVIKGNLGEAFDAAREHGVRIHDTEMLLHGEVVAKTRADITTLQSWFREGGRVAPFPAGTLLTFAKVTS